MTRDQEKIYDERQKEKELANSKEMNESEIDRFLRNWDNHDVKDIILKIHLILLKH